MLYILGIITGLVIAVIVFLAAKRYQVPLDRSLKQMENVVKEKGEIYIETDEKQEFENFISNLPKE